MNWKEIGKKKTEKENTIKRNHNRVIPMEQTGHVVQ